MTKKTIYFLCTGNACRSQIAEGWAKKLLPDWNVQSAGIVAHGINPKAIACMEEIGIDISQQKSTVMSEEIYSQADLVVTLCADADENCPIVRAEVPREHWGFEDPARATGTEAEQWLVFQQVRDAIGERIKQFAKEKV
ncbi:MULTISPECIES: arsenate reductase (thioredoxin) [Brochothrix]|uniref:arsenate reductase (thioredoxin) n=1 Tax=Brochothrix TaxID=2755 RepID=UPI00048C667F|nr:MULTISPECIES: arsenate reductase (thioredoxin) [Brochothrix]MBR5526884.1 arsenate reductase (thioredoxin) [Brochothrix sp.]ODJ47942.1 arsenate reductase (thioredoxin) [Brochothrix thermosphacta DSM 20171 = FSL F6-1036]ODJ55151.1 arsenate reductase (thioredoxin) [Brochothrix thermosphacta]ODJ61608.1 arsenate reductase (thioredoxin) [Brochothrix thermosphacta]ODJ64788.1 arsenate reductase (thioredoxin) [Brochothrix thermosphacta]